MFKEVHGGRKMHWGSRRTWFGLNTRFSGHKIPYRWIQLKVEECLTDTDFDLPLEDLCKLTDVEAPNYLEEEGMFRPKEFTTDFVDAKEPPVESEADAMSRNAVHSISNLVEQHVPFVVDKPSLRSHDITIAPPQGRGKDAVVVKTDT